MLWKETTRLFDEMVAGEGWSTRSSVDIPIVNTITNKVGRPQKREFMLTMPLCAVRPHHDPDERVRARHVLARQEGRHGVGRNVHPGRYDAYCTAPCLVHAHAEMGVQAPNQEASATILLLILCSHTWGFDIPRHCRLRDAGKAAGIALEFLRDMIRTRKQEIASGAPLQSDILSLMIQCAESESEEKLSMTEHELVKTSTFRFLSR